MFATKLLAWVVCCITLKVLLVGDELHKTTQIAQLLEEMEQRSQGQNGFAWGALLFAALQQWQFWAVTGVLILFFGLCRWLRKRRHEASHSSEEESYSIDTDHVEKEEDDNDGDDANHLGRLLEEHIQWPVQNLDKECQAVKDLVDAFIFFFRDLLSNSFFPELQPAIGVGSAFEGWNPCEKDITYHLLVPLKPPRGHAFHLELSHEGMGPARIFYIRVEQVCTCTDEQPAENTLCFLHHPKEELRRNQEPSLLHTLCTGSYLDVHKTARWFHQLVKAAWAVSTLSSQYRLTLLPSNRSFRIEVTKNNTERLNIEMMFGVQEGCSDIFLSSQSTADIFTSSTMWSESYAVAEVEFFKYVTESALANSCYLKCLQVCACIMEGNTFFISALKTVMMHFLTDLPVSGWCTEDLLLWLWDIMRYLCLCLEHKRLDHFFFANGNVPKGIILPLALRTGEPLNFFQHLAQDPDAHAEALCEFMELQDRLMRLLFQATERGLQAQSCVCGDLS